MAFRALIVAAILIGSAFAADAQQSVRLEFNEGKINLIARDAPLRAILAEWARLGGATVVNGDRVVGQPLTLELTGVPERQALDILLRGVSGYMIAPRRAGSSGVSIFDRILILPTSVPPRAPPPPTVAARPGPQRPSILGRPPQPEAAPGDAEQDGTEQADEQEPEAPEPLRPGDPRARPSILSRPVNPNTAAEDDAAEQPDDDVPAVKPTPSNPFGIPAGSSATPGIVTPLPQGQQRPGPARVQ